MSDNASGSYLFHKRTVHMDKIRIRMNGAALLLAVGMGLLGTPARAQNDAATTFKGKCAGCHGPDGSGNTAIGTKLKMRDLGSADVQKQTDAQFTDIIVNGKSPMPGYKGQLTDAQIKQMVGYIRGLAKK
jgi:mono/diheme cytochrome c family protein